MLPSMYSAISGLKANQRKLDVVGNNIANSSTTAFKSQNVTYEDVMSETISGASGASGSTGGVNAQQVGMGVQISGTDTDTTRGDMQPTNNPLDCAINGTGYFVVGSGALPTDSTSTTSTGTIAQSDPSTHLITPNSVNVSYTRDGSFGLDSQGNLHTASGLRVYGYPNSNATITYSTDANTQHTVQFQNSGVAAINDTGLVPMVIPNSVSDGTNTYPITQISIGTNGYITATYSGGSVVLGQLAEVSFSNEQGLTKEGNNTYSTSPNSGNAILRSAGTDTTNVNSSLYGDILSDKLEASNVDLASQFTDMIVASRSFEANGKIITTDDEILNTLVNLKR